MMYKRELSPKLFVESNDKNLMLFYIKYNDAKKKSKAMYNEIEKIIEKYNLSDDLAEYLQAHTLNTARGIDIWNLSSAFENSKNGKEFIGYIESWMEDIGILSYREEKNRDEYVILNIS